MSTNSSIVDEIDAIIAKAMQEYKEAKGIDLSAPEEEQKDVVEEQVVKEEPIHEEIPVNSKSVLISETTSRFSSAIWFNNIKEKSVILAGVGGIGSYIAFLLSRLHIRNLILYDDDTIEAANMSGQLYGRNDIGKYKIFAINNFMNIYSDFFDVSGFTSRFTEESLPTDIMICGFDNMESRRVFFESWLRHTMETNPENCLFIDGRLAAESLQIFCIKGDDLYNIDNYRNNYLFTDDQADETICSYKQTSFMANMIGSLIVNLFVNFCANQCEPLVPRDLPFYTEYTAETMYFKVVE